MRTGRTLVHPEVIELMNICAISPDGSREVCELLQKMTAVSPTKKKQSKKADKELDRDLEDTFPASDPCTHY